LLVRGFFARIVSGLMVLFLFCVGLAAVFVAGGRADRLAGGAFIDC
jgi:hypothetical protein